MRLTVLLIFLIPNIAFSKNVYDTIPKSNINFNKLFGYELDYSFQYDGEGFFSEYQNFDNEKFPYVSRKQEDLPARAFRKIDFSDTYGVELLFDKNKTIKGITSDDGFDETFTKLWDMNRTESREYMEKYYPLGFCFEKANNVKKAVKLKLDIKDEFKDIYRYFPEAGNREIILSYESLIKSKNDESILITRCNYSFDRNDKLDSDFYISLYKKNVLEEAITYYSEMEPEKKNFSDESIIKFDDFKKVYEILLTDTFDIMKEI